MENLDALVKRIVSLPTETEWIEFKQNFDDPYMIGQDISALSNAAALCDKHQAYMIWGIDDIGHQITGTSFDYRQQKKGNEELENWLRHHLSSNANFRFIADKVDNIPLIVLIIYSAIDKTVMFDKIDYIRVGSYTKKLNDYPEIKAQLWDKLRCTNFEGLFSKHNLNIGEVLKLLEYPVYFDIKGEPIPTNQEGIIHYFKEEDLVVQQDNGLYAITNLGAILFAKQLSDFPHISRKAVRVVQYKGKNRIEMLKENTGHKGYASGFENLIMFIDALLPTNEVIETAFRKTVSEYPSIAIREAVANALIHQDFSISGTGPLIEIFSDRIEITNPGIPLVDIKRIIDNPPQSRNEKLASLMRKLKMCEELGTGWDKIVSCCEAYQLPAPKIELYEQSTKVTMFSHIPYTEMAIQDRIRACYLHACLKQVCNEQMCNQSLRERFGLSAKVTAGISRLIRDSVEAGWIKPYDPDTAPRYMRYIPFWA